MTETAVDARLAGLESAAAQLIEAQVELHRALARRTTVVDAMRGSPQLRYRQHAVGSFAPLLRRLRAVPVSDDGQFADEAERAGRLTEAAP